MAVIVPTHSEVIMVPHRPVSRILLGVFAVLWLFVTEATACEQVRAALDIGSGTTKMLVARVDYCRNRVVQVLAPVPGDTLQRQVEYSRNILTQPDGTITFSDEIVTAGLTAIAQLKQAAVGNGATAFSGVATAAFRAVDPAFRQMILERIRKETGFQVRVISREQEAHIGFAAAAMITGARQEGLIVWDIGGGSFQISGWDERNGSVVSNSGDFASEAMRKFVIEEVQGKDARTALSPNPMGEAGVSRAVLKAETIARAISSGLTDRLRNAEFVVGIGGVHFSSNCEFMRRSSPEGCTFTREELLNQLRRYSNLSDRELVNQGFSPEEYAPSRLSNAALTAGFMDAFSIGEIRAIEVNMARGILLHSSLWDDASAPTRTAQ